MSFGPAPGSPFGPPPTGQTLQNAPAPFPPGQFSDNPYAAPSVPAGYTQAFVPGQILQGAGVWRQDKLLVMHVSASLPPICVKSNQPAAAPLLRKLQWHSPWAYLGLLGGLLPFVILALVLTKRASINIGLSQDWIDRRKRRMLVAWLIGLGSVLVGVLGVVLGAQGPGNEGFFLLLVVGFVGVLGALIFGQAACRMVTAKKITDQFVFMSGVCPEFLNRFEPFPYVL